MDINISKTDEPEQIATVAKLANEIWPKHFIPIIGDDQVDYMLKKFQSLEAINEQITSGAEYYLASVDKKAVAYTCLIADETHHKMMISKLYVLLEKRHIGIGTRLLDFIQKECNAQKLDTIWLTVNRFNHETIEWYQRKGFAITDTIKKEIGGGFFMDDFLMEMKI